MAEKAVPDLAGGLQLLGPGAHPCAPCHPPGWGCRELPGAGGSCPFIPEGHSDEGLRHGQPRGLGTLPAI